MTGKLLNMFKVYEDEIVLLLWTVTLLFIIRSAGTLLNNFAETAFLKRYGVEYLPVVNMVNAVITFLYHRCSDGALPAVWGPPACFPGCLSSCGFCVTAIRLAIPYGALKSFILILFMMKSQFEMLQALMFWNLANDLYNNRQSKRLVSPAHRRWGGGDDPGQFFNPVGGLSVSHGQSALCLSER